MGCHLQLKWKKFGLSHHEPVRFGTAQWQDKNTVSVPYLLYRCVVFDFFWAFFFWDIIFNQGIDYYFIYLTNWTYLTALADILVQLVSAFLAAYRCRKGVKPVLPEWLYKMHWVIINVSHTMEPFVSLLYWSAVYPQIDIPVTYTDIHLHLLTTLYTLLDLMVHGSPRRYHHFTFPMAYGVAYLLFTLVYYFCGGLDPYGNTGIYPILDWARPGLTIGVAIGAIVAVLVLHGLTWGLVQLRLRLHGRWLGTRVSVDVDVRRDGGGSGAGGGGGGRTEDGGGRGQEMVSVSTKRGQGDGEEGALVEVCVNVDIGDGAAATAGRPAGGNAARRQAGAGKAFDNAALEVDADDVAGTQSGHNPAV